LKPEAGATLAGTLVPEHFAQPEHRSMGGIPFMPLPIELEEGYHRLAIRIAHTEAATTLILTPSTAFAPGWLDRGKRRWSIASPLFSLWSHASRGIGDFSDLAALLEVAGALGASTVGLNPLHAPLPRESSDPNPYLPSSRLFLNPIFVDVVKALTLADQHAGRTWDHDPQFSGPVGQVRNARLVDYPLLKSDALEAIYRSRLGEQPTAGLPCDADRLRVDLSTFRRQHGDALTRFAVFNALQERFGSVPWHQWPTDLRTPDAAGIAGFERECGDRVGYHAWLQWVADQQLAAAAGSDAGKERIGLYRDLAVGIHPDGADAWAAPDVYLIGASMGAPPDAFNPAGQDWGIPPPSPPALRANGYAPFVAAVRANMWHAQVLRIDHVMGLQRLYWVPSGSSARSGAYVRYPLNKMLGILALESWRNRCLIVGEDLGTLPQGFRERMAEAGIMSYRLMMFERYPDGLFRRPSTYPRLAAATFGTHDLPTIRGWWKGRDIEIRRALGLWSEGEAEQEERRRQADRTLLLAALRDQQLDIGALTAAKDIDPTAIADLVVAIEQFLARSPSALTVVNLSDMLAEVEQINVPGTVSQHPNWRHRFGLPVDAITTNSLARRIAMAIASERSWHAAPARRARGG
jgi:4-alpha-glucanotransferase